MTKLVLIFVTILVTTTTSSLYSSAAPPVPEIPCTRKDNGHFADTCHDIHLLPDHKSLNASCATDGSMTHFRVNRHFNLDRRIVNFNGQLQVVLNCANAYFPLLAIYCDFSHYCRNIELVNFNGSDSEVNGTITRVEKAVFLNADCPDRHGQLHTNQLDLNPYITNKKGKLKWSCTL